MVSKYFLIPTLLSAMLVVGSDGDLFARGGGGGGGGGGHGGGGGGGGRGGYGGGGYGRGFGGGGYGYGGYGFGGGLFYGGYGGGLYYGDYGGGYYPYSAPVYAPPIAPAMPYATPSTSYYYPPPPVALADSQPAAVAAAPASIHVIVPDPQATVLFDGKKTSTMGTDRLYTTPPLTHGGSYSYRLRVSWMQDGQQMNEERVVVANPGRTTEVVFSRNEGTPAVSAK